MSFDYPTTILNRNSNQSISNSTWTRVSWDNEQEDDLNTYDNATDAFKIVIPAGVTQARFVFSVAWDNNSSGSRYITVEKNSNGTQGSALVAGMINNGANNESGLEYVTKWLTVTPGDTFEFWVFQDSGGTRTLSGSAGFGGPGYVQAEFVVSTLPASSHGLGVTMAATLTTDNFAIVSGALGVTMVATLTTVAGHRQPVVCVIT